MTTENGNLEVNVFWSMRSPYCYVSLDRCLEFQRKYNLTLHLKPVYPIAIRDASWFKAADEMKYRLPYQDADNRRSAEFHDMPYNYPVPDPVAQEHSEGGYGKIEPFEKQRNIQVLTRTAVGAAEMGKGWEYLNEVMRLVWNGSKRPWNKPEYVRDAIQAAGIDADALLNDVEANPDKYDNLIERNQELQKENTCKHTGVPLFVFRYEPFFGQDRMDQLIWRLKQYGLREKTDNA